MCVLKIQAWLKEWSATRGPWVPQSVARSLVSRTLSPANVVKVNVDGALLLDEQVVALRCVIHDNVGTLLETSSFCFTYAARDPMFVEAGVILWGLREVWMRE